MFCEGVTTVMSVLAFFQILYQRHIPHVFFHIWKNRWKEKMDSQNNDSEEDWNAISYWSDEYRVKQRDVKRGNRKKEFVSSTYEGMKKPAHPE